MRIAWGEKPGEGGRISSEFGPRILDGEHNHHWGIDIAAPLDTLIRASAGGVVSRVGFDERGYGHYVYIDHREGIETRYAHMNDPPTVAVGDNVLRGHILGRVGSTGKSTGPHLHYEHRLDGDSFNPRDYLPEGVYP